MSIPDKLRRLRDGPGQTNATVDLLDAAADLIEEHEASLEALRAQIALTQGTDSTIPRLLATTVPADLEAICAYVRAHAATIVDNTHPVVYSTFHQAAQKVHRPQ